MLRRLFVIYETGVVLVSGSVGYVNYVNGTGIIKKLYGDPKYSQGDLSYINYVGTFGTVKITHCDPEYRRDERRKIILITCAKAFTYGIGWPISVSKMYYDYIGNENFKKHTCPRYNETFYGSMYEAAEIGDEIKKFIKTFF